MGRRLIQCDSVSFSYSEKPVLQNITIQIDSGSFTGIVGRNGVGKSTLIRILTGTLIPQQGSVLLDGIPIRELPRRVVARKLAVVTQTEPNDFGFTVWEEVMLGRSPRHGGIYFENNEDRGIVKMALEKTQITHLAARTLDTLSGGERQRVRVARGIAQQPEVIFLDEPTTHLDIHSQLKLMELLKDINKNGIAVFLVSHDINFLSQCCHDVHLMRNGTISIHGTPREVITYENVAECFGIEAEITIDPVTHIPRINPLRILSDHNH